MRRFSGSCLLIPAFFPLILSGNGWFTENKGQIFNTEGLAMPEVKFTCPVKGSQIFFSEKIIWVIIYSRQDGGCRIRTESVDLPVNEEELTLEGIEPACFVSNYYHARYPNGITGVRGYGKLVWKNRKGEVLYTARFEKNGSVKLVGAVEMTGKSTMPNALQALPWSTFLGGTDTEESWGVDHDPSGNVIVCGQVYSTDFPVSQNCMQDTSAGMYDAFISKFDPDGNLLWSTYYGGTGNDFAMKTVTGSDHTVYVTGYTSGNDLPVSNGCWQSSSAGSYDGFLIKMTASGIRIWATYFGGNGGDLSLSIARDAFQNIFIGGSSSSTSFPVSTGAFQQVNNGPLDGWIARFDSSGSRSWCTLYGGSSSDDVHALSSDMMGSVVVIGGTFSTDFPVTFGCFQGFNAGVKDLFIARFDAAGNRLFSTYYGGTAWEDGLGVSTDGGGNIFISGTTSSNDFPVSPGCWQAASAGGDDIFVMKFDSSGNRGWATYFGGSGTENCYGMDSPGNDMYFITLSTSSNDVPVIGPGPFPVNQGSSDAFIVKFNRYGIPAWSTYYGGSNQDIPHAISVDVQQGVAFTGLTSSADYPVTFGAFQIGYAGNDDAFVTELDGTFDNTLSVTSSGTLNPVLIYPNPLSDDRLFIRSGEIILQADLLNPEGQLMDVGPINNSTSVVLSGMKRLSPGIYIVKVRTATEFLSLPLIICR